MKRHNLEKRCQHNRLWNLSLIKRSQNTIQIYSIPLWLCFGVIHFQDQLLLNSYSISPLPCSTPQEVTSCHFFTLWSSALRCYTLTFVLCTPNPNLFYSQEKKKKKKEFSIVFDLQSLSEVSAINIFPVLFLPKILPIALSSHCP